MFPMTLLAEGVVVLILNGAVSAPFFTVTVAAEFALDSVMTVLAAAAPLSVMAEGMFFPSVTV